MFGSLEIRIVGALVLAILFTAGGYRLASLHYEAIIAKEDAARADMAALAAERAKDKEDAANTHNAQVVAGLQTQLDALGLERTALANRLQNAIKADSGSLPQAGNHPGITPATRASGDGRLAELLAAAVSECRRNDDRYASLIEEVATQL
jgi:hypothetical protein